MVNKKILIIGDIIGNYRAQNIIDYFHKKNLYKCETINSKTISFSNYLLNITLGRAIRLLIRFCINIKMFYAMYRNDIVFVLPMNHGWAYKALHCSKILKKPVVTDFYISAYDTKVNDRKIVKKNSKKAIKLKYLDRYIIENSDILVVLADFDIKHICEEVQANPTKEKVRIIPLCINEKNIAILNEKRNQSNFNVCWWGTYIPLHGLETIIEALALLKLEDPDIKLFIFGNNEEKSLKYKNLILDYKLTEKVFIHNDMTFDNGRLQKFLIYNADLALGIFGESKKAKSIIANKIIDAIAMKIPVLTMDTLALDEFFCKEKHLFTCSNNHKEIAEAILYIKKNRMEAIQRANQAYEIYKNTFSVKKFYKNMDNLLKEIT